MCHSKKWFFAKSDQFSIPSSEDANDAENTSEPIATEPIITEIC